MSADLTTQGVGRTVGSYALEEEIGRGGMGVVYRARRLDTGETVALKLMLPEIAANTHFRARFVREASLGSDLDHPNIVPIYDAGDDQGDLFIAMRLVEGRDLKTLIEEEGALEPKRILAILRQVAAALDAAHESGLVHHDVKPQNILVSGGDGTPEVTYVTDFGLVRPAGSESTASRTGQVFGSIQYMAPEQVEGMPADGRADVYALGCVLFECLTGQIPFDRPNEVAVLWAHVHEAPARVTDLHPELPGGLDAVVATAMAKHPEDRFLTCGELIEELERGLDRKHRPVVMPLVRPLVRRIPKAKTEREVWAPNYFPELSRVRKISNRVNWIQVAGVTSILCLLAAALVQFAHPGGVRGAVTDVATAVGTKVLDAGVKISAALDDEDEAGPSRSGGVAAITASRRNAFSDGDTEIAPRDVRPRRRSAQAPAPSAEAVVQQPRAKAAPVALSDKIAFVSTRQGSFDIYTARANGSKVESLTRGPSSEFDPAFSPDGSRIAFARAAYRDTLLDCPTGPCPYDSHIYVMNSDGSEVTQLSVGSDVFDGDPAWSPDGRSIVFTRWPGEQNADLYILTQGENGSWTQSQLTSLPGSEIEAAFSPDGSTLLYSGEHDTDATWSDDDPHKWDLFALDVDGEVTRLTRDAGAGTPVWSPDGSRIAYAGRKGVFTMRADGSSITRLTKGADYYVDWSPDGQRVAFQRCARLLEKCRVMSYDFRSGSSKVVADDVGDYDGMPAWAPVR